MARRRDRGGPRAGRRSGATATDWRAVAALYAQLERLRPTPVVRLNRAVAVAEADAPEAGLALLEGLDLPGPGLPAARADLLARLGRAAAALRAYDEALAAAGNAVVRAHLSERRAGVAARLM